MTELLAAPEITVHVNPLCCLVVVALVGWLLLRLWRRRR